MPETSNSDSAANDPDADIQQLTSPDPNIEPLPVLRTPISRIYRYEECADCDVQGTHYFHVYVRAEELRAQKLPLDANPRLPVPGTVTRKMVKTLEETPGDFHLLNNGITIIAKSVSNNAESRELTIEFGAKAAHTGYGICNGGHTYMAIVTLPQQPSDAALVRLEVAVLPQSLTEPERLQTIQRIANARNSHSALKSTTEANFFGLYDLFKSCLGTYSHFVRWREGDRDAIPEALLADKFVSLLASISPEWYAHPRGGGEGNHLSAARNVKNVHYTWSQQRKEHLDALARGEVSAARKHLDEVAPLAKDVLRLLDMISYSLLNDPVPTVGQGWRRTAVYESVYKRERQLLHDDFASKKGSDLAHPHAAMLLGAFRHNVWLGTLEDDLDHPLVGWSLNPDRLWQDSRGNLLKKICEFVQNETKKSVADVLAKHIGAYSLQLMELQFGANRPSDLDLKPYEFYMYDEEADVWNHYVHEPDRDAAGIFMRHELADNSVVSSRVSTADDAEAVGYTQVD
jgi:hypothetical protein